MSAALVRQSLAIVDPDSEYLRGKKAKKVKNALHLMPENQRIKKDVKCKGRKVKKDLLTSTKKLTVAEARQNFKSKEQILKENLLKLKLIKEACTIDLDDDVASQIIERARTRRPVAAKTKAVDDEKSAFTEDDFRKFEAEYFDE